MNHTAEIQALEKEAHAIATRLENLRRENDPVPVRNYPFETLTGPTDLLTLFGDKDTLIVIHNMGHGCRWCTSWADGLNAALPHLENSFAVVLVSKNDPASQRRFALERGWNFRMASHGGGEYAKEQASADGEADWPGIACFVRKDGQVFRKNGSLFGPGDSFNPLFHVVTLAGVGMEEFTPQFSYWKRPAVMDDGGQDL